MRYFVFADGRLAAIAFDETTARRIASKLVQCHARDVLVLSESNELIFFSR